MSAHSCETPTRAELFPRDGKEFLRRRPLLHQGSPAAMGRTGGGWKRGPSAPGGRSGQLSLPDSWLTITSPPLHVFCKYIILRVVKVLCFDRLLQVLILKGLVTRDS